MSLADKILAAALSLGAIALAVLALWTQSTPTAIASVTLAISAFPRQI